MAPPSSDDCDLQKKVFDCVAKNNVSELKVLLSDFHGDMFDEHGMTPLQHAAYKGNKEIVQLLLDQGADVNSSQHEHGYTALHFAVLSGNSDVCQLLMCAGAKKYAKNSVGKTPMEMGGFVGNHQCVAIINNFIPREEIDYYTVPRGLETEPKLPSSLAGAFHKFAMQVNMNPVRIALNLQPTLVNSLDPVRNVLTIMSEREMKKIDMNEVMGFKLHFLAAVVAEIAKCRQPDREKPGDPVEAFARKVLRSVRGPEYVERFVRDCVREFPFRESYIFRQMVATLAKGSHCGLNTVCALVCPRMFPESDKDNVCATCSEQRKSAMKKCAKCKLTQYCDRSCQRLHWFVHKKECERISTAVTTTTTTKENNVKLD